MYRTYYNLKEKPFEITPDPSFLYLSENHKEALAHLTYAVSERKGFTVITGEVGTGKTTLIHTMLNSLNGHTKTAYIFNPKLKPTDFLYQICEDFGLTGHQKSKVQCLAQLHHFLMNSYYNSEQAILIVDEAQHLDTQLLEEVRLLTNLETTKTKLLQVILTGQPELNDILNNPECRQLKQRVSLRYHMHPLNKEDMKKYIEQRLRIAGAVDTDLFNSKALDSIFHYTKGIPRSINIVCDNALLTGYATDQKVIGKPIIKEVIHNLEGAGLKKKQTLFRPVTMVLLSMLCLTIGFFIWNYEIYRNGHLDITRWLQSAKELVERIYQNLPERVTRLF